MGNLETLFVEPVQHFDANAGAPFRPHCLPARHGLLAGINQHLHLAHRVLHIEINPKRRLLAPMPAYLAGLSQLKLFAQVVFIRALAVFGRRGTVHLGAWHFVVSRPVTAGLNGVERAIERSTVFFEQGVSHQFFLGKAFVEFSRARQLVFAMPIQKNT